MFAELLKEDGNNLPSLFPIVNFGFLITVIIGLIPRVGAYCSSDKIYRTSFLNPFTASTFLLCYLMHLVLVISVLAYYSNYRLQYQLKYKYAPLSQLDELAFKKYSLLLISRKQRKVFCIFLVVSNVAQLIIVTYGYLGNESHNYLGCSS